MASLELLNQKAAASLPHADLQAALAVVESRLERADAIENQIERLFKRDDLLELYDWLAAEIALGASHETPLK
jgi:hypothetical protein